MKRPQPPIPLHGSARKGIHMATKFSMHPEQEKWLERNVFKDGLEQMRPSAAWVSMKAFFPGKIRVDTMTPMWLEKDQIAKWLAGKKSEEKARRKAMKAASKKKQLSGLTSSSPSASQAKTETKARAKRKDKRAVRSSLCAPAAKKRAAVATRTSSDYEEADSGPEPSSDEEESDLSFDESED